MPSDKRFRKIEFNGVIIELWSGEIQKHIVSYLWPISGDYWGHIREVRARRNFAWKPLFTPNLYIGPYIALYELKNAF